MCLDRDDCVVPFVPPSPRLALFDRNPGTSLRTRKLLQTNALDILANASAIAATAAAVAKITLKVIVIRLTVCLA